MACEQDRKPSEFHKKWGCVAPESNVKSVSSLAPSQRPRIGKKVRCVTRIKNNQKVKYQNYQRTTTGWENFRKKFKYIFWSQQGKTKKNKNRKWTCLNQFWKKSRCLRNILGEIQWFSKILKKSWDSNSKLTQTTCYR